MSSAKKFGEDVRKSLEIILEKKVRVSWGARAEIFRVDESGAAIAFLYYRSGKFVYLRNNVRTTERILENLHHTKDRGRYTKVSLVSFRIFYGTRRK